jgi:hypothetical protein
VHYLGNPPALTRTPQYPRQRRIDALPGRRSQFIEGVVRYIGLVDGKACVTSVTKEGAVCSLLRRLAYAPA